MTKDEALAKEKALQALHDENERLGLYKDAYAEQEPVAWWNDTGTHIDLNVSGRGTPLYTHPLQRTWVGLTDEDFYGQSKWQVMAMKYAEAKLKERNT